MLQGGNPDLQPETADTHTSGGVFTLRFLPGLQASIDYYHIDLSGIIGSIPLAVSYDNCLAGIQTFGKSIVRNVDRRHPVLQDRTARAGIKFTTASVGRRQVVQGLRAGSSPSAACGSAASATQLGQHQLQLR